MRAIRDAQPVLDKLCDRLWPPQPRTPVSRPLRRLVTASDVTILSRARSAKNGAAFARLWAGDWRDAYGSQSEGDLALCAMLAFWCGNDSARVDHLFRQSGLYRDKWDRDDYRRATLERACGGLS